jgi:hypothetical protein
MVNFLSFHFTDGLNCSSSILPDIPEALNVVLHLPRVEEKSRGVLTRSAVLGNADFSDPGADYIDNRRNANLLLSVILFLFL